MGRTASAACRTGSPRQDDPAARGCGLKTEFNTDAKIIDFINTGSVLGGPALAAMPHWGGIISDPDLASLAAYINTLK